MSENIGESGIAKTANSLVANWKINGLSNGHPLSASDLNMNIFLHVPRKTPDLDLIRLISLKICRTYFARCRNLSGEQVKGQMIAEQEQIKENWFKILHFKFTDAMRIKQTCEMDFNQNNNTKPIETVIIHSHEMRNNQQQENWYS